MNEFQKMSRWISEIEQDLVRRRDLKASLDERITSKIHFISQEVAQIPDTALKMGSIKRLGRVASMLESDPTFGMMQEVEKEVDAIYGDLSKNDTYYFRNSSKDLDEMKALTTYEENSPQFGEVLPQNDFNAVQDQLKKEVPVKTSSWSDFHE